MTPIVVDAGVILEIAIFGTKATDARSAIEGLRPEAPGHILIETGGVIRRLTATGRISERDADKAIARVAAFPVRLHQVGAAEITGAWRHRHNLTMADAAYVVIAERLGAALLTLDAAFTSPPAPPCDVITL